MTSTPEATHEIVYIDEKPNDLEIKKLNATYYAEFSKDYDQFNESTDQRQRFQERVDSIISAELRKKKVEKLLTICCGSGFREQRIMSELDKSIKTTGVDSSEDLCFQALERGLDMICGDWPASVNLDSLFDFDAAFMLHSLGASPSSTSATIDLKTIYNCLKKGAFFFVGAMNLEDSKQWGPEIVKHYSEKSLVEKGYSLGDVFYKRKNTSTTAFFHYYTTDELQKLGELQGFKHFRTWYVGTTSNAGELVSINEGSILMMFTK